MAETESVALDRKQKTELQTEGNEAAAFLNEIRGYEVRTQEDLEFLNSALQEIKRKRKFLEDKRKSVTNPMLQAVNVVRSWFDAPEGYYKLLEVELKDKIAKAMNSRTEQNSRALAAAESAHKNGDHTGVRMALSTVHTLERVPGLSTREQWDYEVEDLAVIPREYLQPNPKAIRDAMRMNVSDDGSPKEIQGIRFVKRTIVSSRIA